MLNDIKSISAARKEEEYERMLFQRWNRCSVISAAFMEHTYKGLQLHKFKCCGVPFSHLITWYVCVCVCVLFFFCIVYQEFITSEVLKLYGLTKDQSQKTDWQKMLKFGRKKRDRVDHILVGPRNILHDFKGSCQWLHFFRQ